MQKCISFQTKSHDHSCRDHSGNDGRCPGLLDVRRAVALVVRAAGKVPGAAGAAIRVTGGCAVTPASTRSYKMNGRFDLKSAEVDLWLRELAETIGVKNSLNHSTLCLTLYRN